MRSRLIVFCLAVAALGSAQAQQDTTSRQGASSTSRPATGAARGSTRGPLPDPALLDGSNQPAEKKPEYGMLGEFEIPGDDNAKSDKVGGQQNPNQQGGGGGQPQNQAQAQGGGGQQGGLPKAGGGGGPQQPGQVAQQAGGGGGAPGGEQAANPNGPAGGDPNAKAEGIQVAGLQGDPSGAQGGPGGDGAQKPKQVAIGDTAMQIKPVGNAPGVVGQQTLGGSTQQMESKIGKGSGPGSTQQSGKGVEKGRTIPTGL